MIRFLIIFLASTAVSYKSMAQSAQQHDGIVITPSSVNNEVFYYGEPIFIYFNVTNTNNAPAFYHAPSPNTNYRLILKNLTTGEVKESRRWLSHPRGAQQMHPPTADKAYQPKEILIVQNLLNSNFAGDKLSEKMAYSYNLANKLIAVASGKYELTLEYHLLPSDKKILASHRFEIKEVPADQKAAFEQYVKATAYAANTYRRGGKGTYSATHPDSYENFLQRYPNSFYSTYAFMDMVKEVYIYPIAGEQTSIEKFMQYATYFPHIEKSSLKMNYITFLPFTIANIPGNNLQGELDQFLRQELIEENPELSTALISAAGEIVYQVKGLKNYAKETIPK